MSKLLLAVDQKENRRLLLEYLERHHTITLSDSADGLTEPFDLGIFDGHALHRLDKHIFVRKEAARPLFLPILLVTPRQDVGMITRQLWRVVDEIIFIPIEKTELTVRIEVLLRARRLSLELEERNLQLQQEIGGHQETELALAVSEERFRVGLKNSQILVAHCDRDLRYIWVHNPEGLFGAQPIVGKRDDELITSSSAKPLMEMKRAALENGTGGRRDIEIGERVFDVTVEPLYNDRGRITGATMAALDVTESKQAEGKARELVALEERQRLAADLHDAVSQTLYTMNMMTQALPRQFEQHPERIVAQIGQLQQLSQSALAEMRTLLLELRPANLVKTRLAELFSQLGNSIQTRRDIQMTSTVDVEEPLPEDVHLAFYRIVQEALNNISKHSEATEASIKLVAEKQGLVLRIRDNGKGFDVDASGTGGMGLGIMRERAATIGAHFKMRRVKAGGTEITVTWDGNPNKPVIRK